VGEGGNLITGTRQSPKERNDNINSTRNNSERRGNAPNRGLRGMRLRLARGELGGKIANAKGSRPMKKKKKKGG